MAISGRDRFWCYMRSICKINGCGKPVNGLGLCSNHYQMFKRNGDPNIRTRRERGTGGYDKSGYLIVGDNGDRTRVHISICEKAICKELPPGAVVHHVDRNPRNNSNTNLVVCPSTEYHQLLHVRTRALDACGNANWRKCKRCGKYDAPENLSIYKTEAIHSECNRLHVARYRK